MCQQLRHFTDAPRAIAPHFPWLEGGGRVVWHHEHEVDAQSKRYGDTLTDAATLPGRGISEET